MSEREPPKFGPIDDEGFQTVSFYTANGAEHIRISVNIERICADLTSTAADPKGYSEPERDSLKVAAAILAARNGSASDDPEVSLRAILESSIDHTAQTIEHSFPVYVRPAILAAMNICLMRELNILVQTLGAPKIYKEDAIDSLLSDFKASAKGFIGIRRGRLGETANQLRETWFATMRLRDKCPSSGSKGCFTQQDVARELGVDPSALHEWFSGLMTWEEWVRASEIYASFDWGNS